ncbi:MAG TPA: metallopeptidase TldD-related protein [Kofleriaceae bacterium]|nr:metallopeptidase TldD-related protein [Kofleriaceae bacterium]
MGGWSRREVLAALAAAGAAPGWSALLGCGGARPRPAPRPEPVPAETFAQLRDQLRQVAADLGRRFRSVAVRAELGQLTRVVVEPDERAVDQRGRSSVILAGFDGASWFQEAGTDLSPDAVARAARALAARAPAGRGARPGAAAAAARPGGATAGRARLAIDPRDRPIGDWLARAGRLHERATRVGGSRLVYRAACIEVDDSDVVFVGDGRDVAQRLVRTGARVLFLAWTGSALAAEEAAGAGAVGLEGAELAGGELERAAEGALTLLTGGRIEPGARDLLLDPSVTALLVREAARGWEGDVWARGGARAAGLEGKAGAAGEVSLRDDATAAGAFGGYSFDDEGWAASPHALLEHGVVRGPLCDAAAAAALRRPRTGHGRRGALGEDGVAARSSHLVLAAGGRDRDALVAAIEGQGFLIESGVEGDGDPRSWRVAVRALRAREIERGRLTGRVYGPVVVAGQVPALLGAVRAIERSAGTYGWWRSGVASSVVAPAVVTRGWIGG